MINERKEKDRKRMRERMRGEEVRGKRRGSKDERKGKKEIKSYYREVSKKGIVDVNGMTRGAGGETYGEEEQRDAKEKKEKEGRRRQRRNITSQIFCPTSTALHFG